MFLVAGSHTEDCWRCSNISKYFHGNQGTFRNFNQSSQKQEIEREDYLQNVDKNPEKKKNWLSLDCK